MAISKAVKRFKPALHLLISKLLILIVFAGNYNFASAVKAPVLHPPMGWNSFDCFNYSVTESEILQNAHYMAEKLKPLGWEYCVVDFIWWIPYMGDWAGSQGGNMNLGNLDKNGRLWPDTTRFPSAKGGKGFKPLADSIHNLGLKFGIHVMRGVPRMAVKRDCPILNSTYTCTQAADQNSTCSWLDWMYGTNMANPAGQAYLNSILNLYNSWDVDFVKVDDLSAPYHSAEIEGYARAIDSVSREVVLSTSPGATPLNQASHISKFANMWRLVNDFWDIDFSNNKNWNDITNAYSVAESWRKTLVNGNIIAGPGHWPDVDMLPFGHLSLRGPRGSPRYTLSTLTKGEHRLIMFLWCINNQPLMYGGNMPDNKNNPFYDSLMMNKDCIYIDQNGISGKVLKSSSTNTAIWTSSDPQDTTVKFLMIANLSQSSASISIDLNELGITKSVSVKNIWTGEKIGNFTNTFAQTIPSHDAGLYIIGEKSVTANKTDAQFHYLTSSSVEKTYLTINNQLTVPSHFNSKLVRISIYSLDGKLLSSIITSKPVEYSCGKRFQPDVRIIKIKELNVH
jgi:hypothetical protein